MTPKWLASSRPAPRAPQSSPPRRAPGGNAASSRSPSCRRGRPTARSGAAGSRAGWSRGSGRPRPPCRDTSARRRASAGGRISTNSPSSSATTLQPMRMCRLSDSDLYCERDEDAAEAGVDAVAEGEVDDAVGAAEVDRRFGAFLGQGIESFADPAGQHDHECVVLHLALSVSAHACRRPVPAERGGGNRSGLRVRRACQPGVSTRSAR